MIMEPPAGRVVVFRTGQSEILGYNANQILCPRYQFLLYLPEPTMMNLTQLRYFVSVAHRKSLSAAAVEMNISQPAITRQLKLLEAELDGALFTRQQRGIELSE